MAHLHSFDQKAAAVDGVQDLPDVLDRIWLDHRESPAASTHVSIASTKARPVLFFDVTELFDAFAYDDLQT